MNRVPAVITVLTIATVAAGCGSSHNGGAKNAAASAPAAAPASSSGGYGGYGTSASSSSTAARAAAGSATAVRLTTKHHGKLGEVLAAGPKQLTVYMFEADGAGKSNCGGTCTSVWPPVTAAGSPSVAGMAAQADVSTIARPDGTKQLAYKGHPLYYFVRDKDAGDAYGEGVHGFGANWYVLAPSGRKVDNS